MTAPRLQGLDHATAQQVIGAAQELELGRADMAAAQLASALVAYPDHPEVLRLHAGILNLRGDSPGARAAMERAIELRPLDALYHNTLGTVLGNAGDFDAAIRALRRACELQPDLAIAWYNLGLMLTQCARNTEATEALRRAVELDPDNMDARAQLGELLRMQGRAEEAAAAYRSVLAGRPWTGMAWWGLADLRTGALTGDDIDRMRSAARDNHAGDDDRIAIGFAMAKALDEQGHYSESLDELKRANAIARLRQHWDAQKFSASIDAVNAAFAAFPPNADTAELGREVIFIVGMPRSGTTLVEQILASHSQVEGAGELHDLPQVLAEESRRHSQPLWHLAAEMQPADWQRLGIRYLERTAHWRKRRPKFTDKLPNNWMSLGAIRAMLPGAHIVVCRRDPLETCFSCYRQHLAGNEYTRTPEDLAAFWRDFDRSATHWAGLFPTQVYQHDYEALIANPEHDVRRLLGFCGLPFEEACLRFYENEREVRSPSASQVRKPLDTDTARAQRYGALLDPLRAALGLPLFQPDFGQLTQQGTGECGTIR
ncbi:MAG: tetratricopeptide repeat-containing sulfotransferase family protein [Rhodanobacteraceae bacterium]